MNKENAGIKTIYAIDPKDVKKSTFTGKTFTPIALKKGKAWKKIELNKTISIPQYGQEKPYIGKEDNLQKACANYLDIKNLHYTHPPNGGSRHKMTITKRNGTQATFSPEAQKLKDMGTKSGASDLLIFEPAGVYHGLHIELKVKGGTVNKNQIDFLVRSQGKGYLACVCWNFDAFRSVIENYLKGNI